MLNPGLTCRCALLLLFWITPGFFATIFSQTATLTGTVKDSTGRPVEFAYVAFSGKNGQFGSAPVHADGSYL
ncbi:MAG TPA: hypothetical protein VI731_01085, partial [Bacteroidia bacterium]|nr:hypothetical protein [Bacteroidia bacterium]